MSLFGLSLAYIRARALNAALILVLLALGVGMIVLLLLFSAQLEDRLRRDAQGIDFVIGAKGSPLQLILSAIYHVDFPTGNVPLTDAARWAEHPQVAEAMPLALGDSIAGFRIVGAAHAYVRHYGAEPATGRLWQEPFEATLGAAVAATTGLGVQKPGLYPTVYHALLGSEPAEKSVHSTMLDFLKVLPSDIDLVGAEIELVGLERREYRLRMALDPIIERFDFVVIDCPPSLGLLTINALVAANRVLVPLQCEFYALEGLTHLLKTVKLVRERLNPALSVEGIVLTMFDGRTSLALQIRDEVNRYFPGEIFSTVIPRNVRLSEAPSHGKPVMVHDLRSSGAIAYLELTREVLNHE